MAIKPSPTYAALLLLMHATAAIIVYITEIPLSAAITIFLLIASSLIYHIARDVLLLLPNSWCEFVFVAGGLSAVTRDGSIINCQLKNKPTVSPYFIVLRVGIAGKYLGSARVIFPDMLDEGLFRELCVQLKFLRTDRMERMVGSGLD